MKTKERRELLLNILNKSANPIKGDELANTLNVSRPSNSSRYSFNKSNRCGYNSYTSRIYNI